MTPKQKAKELFDKYYNVDNFGYKRDIEGFIVWSTKVLENQAKKCALIAVDEILKAVTTIADKKYDFYLEVKQEINNL